MILPGDLHSYLVPRVILTDSQRYLAGPGRRGFEAVVVWIGRPLERGQADVLAVIRPAQEAIRTEEGVSVRIPPDAISELISALPEDTAILARLHTHPGEAYHSLLDDTNMLLAHNGAISIVVPDFARAPIELGRCSVNVLEGERGWRELSTGEVAERFKLV
ncbi:MAG: hypothetical protein ACTHO8_07035 [Solirubrobacterales bacterium]